jgi:hypothetical protein
MAHRGVLLKLFIGTALLALTSCESSESDNTNILNGEDYFPLHVGNYWKLSGMPERLVDITETIDNTTYYRIVSSWDTTYYRKTDAGKIFERTKTTGEILKFDLAADAGQTWTYESNNPKYTWRATLLSKNETVELGQTTYKNCYRFYFDIPQMADDEHVIWLAPGIGFIEEYYSGGTAGRKALTKAKIDGVEIEF